VLTKVDIRSIVREHLNSLKNFSTGRSSVADHMLFFGVPVILMASSIITGYDLSDEARGALVNASAIFLGLLLNLLVLMFDQQNKNSERLASAESSDPPDQSRANKLGLFRTVIEQTISNISFTTLLSIFALCLLILHSVLVTKTGNAAPSVTPIISAVTLGLWTCILLTSMMILKRVFSLLINDTRV
jgi:hypothetical protein